MSDLIDYLKSWTRLDNNKKIKRVVEDRLTLKVLVHQLKQK